MQQVVSTRSNAGNLDDDRIHIIGRHGTNQTVGRGETTAGETNTLEGSDVKDDESTDFDIREFIRHGVSLRDEQGIKSHDRLGVAYKDLTVYGVAGGSIPVKTFADALISTLDGESIFNMAAGLLPPLEHLRTIFTRPKPQRKLIQGFTGVVRPGEMMLVLGKPGSGCSTFLSAVASKNSGFTRVEGHVSYGGLSPAEMNKRFRGQVVKDWEDDVHMPTLTVHQTLFFALSMKLRRRLRPHIEEFVHSFARMFGIQHTFQTMVGNEYVRGISGGERKRVSIAETLVSNGSVICWDNATRGLDASTAVDYVRSLRIMTDLTHRSTLTTLYQAGEGIYRLMDKVTVIHEGYCIYYGPAQEARQYFKDLGYVDQERQTTADFLTSITDVYERRFRADFDINSVPKTAKDMADAYHASAIYKRQLADYEDYIAETERADYQDAENFQAAVRSTKSKTISKSSPYTVSFMQQTLMCARREIWLFLGDRTGLYSKFFIIISMSLIIGSLFYNTPSTTAGAFPRGGAIFMAIAFNAWLQLGEVGSATMGRSVINRHKEYAFYNPAAVNMGRILADFPIIAVQCICFLIPMYFLSQFQRKADRFFILLLITYTTTFCLTQFYRLVAAMNPTFDSAIRFAGAGLNVMFILLGYVIQKPVLLSKYIWFGWIYWINPLSYLFEAAISNEFHNRVMECAGSSLVPSGPGYTDSRYQSCTTVGSRAGQTYVLGDDYLRDNYSYSYDHVWRNFGISIAWTVLYIVLGAYFTSRFSFSGTATSALRFKKGSPVLQKRPQKSSDLEGGASDDVVVTPVNESHKEKPGAKLQVGSDSIFTWSNIAYTVPYDGGERKLLDNVSGWCRPGEMTALMGASGAGKTTLLTALSQRIRMGVVTGDFLVDGKALGKDVARRTGLCEQMDIHDATQTIREAFEFSALLRQSNSIPDKEKLAYVDEVVALLELEELQDAEIGSLGVEQRKRTTIGVELCAKPSLLLFLDEPTSGLDSQSAYSIVRFMRKLADAGQAILCTIHQPSTQLIQEFDQILALMPGGKTLYFGPIGQEGKNVVEYFEQYGAHCPAGANIAEFILEMGVGKIKPQITGDEGQRLNDWAQVWQRSAQKAEVDAEIERIVSERKPLPAVATEDGDVEFAAPTSKQIRLYTLRVFRNYWRDPSYQYGKLFATFTNALFNGFLFWKLGNTQNDLQLRLFSAFLIVLNTAGVIVSTIPKFLVQRSLFEFREYPSRIYGWVAFCTGNVVAELPYGLLNGVVYWLVWYWPAGMPVRFYSSFNSFLMTILYFIFANAWGQWITAFAPSFTVISNTMPFFLVMTIMFCGVIVPYETINVFWRYWIYWMSPFHYYVGSLLSSVLHDIELRCTADEFAQFAAPAGMTCAQYAGDFLSTATGYLDNPDAIGEACRYCQYRVGDEYLQAINLKFSDEWPFFAIFILFTVVNCGLVYFMMYFVRIKHYSFGFGFVLGLPGRVLSALRRK